MRRGYTGSVGWLALAVISCSPAPQIPPAAPPSAAAPTVDPAMAAMASVIVARRPERFALDGDLGEWGSLIPPSPEPLRAGEKAPSVDPNPREASSHVAVALTGEGALIAADLGPSAARGVWVGVAARVPGLPPVGEYQRGGGVLPFTECLSPADAPEDYDPRESKDCKELLKKRDDDEASHARRFRQLYRVDASGVRSVKEDGTLAPVEGAKVMWRDVRGGGATAEVSIPLSALPRMSEAPVSWLSVAARPVSTPSAPALAEDAWVSLRLPEPVGFEPWAELRAEAFDKSPNSFYASMSYHPAEPRDVEIITHAGYMNTRSLSTHRGPLFVRQATLGDLEVGYVDLAGFSIAVLRRGALVRFTSPQASPVGVVERGGEIHVFSYAEYTSTDVWTTHAIWTVTAVMPDGRLREKVMEEAPTVFSWAESPSKFHDPSFTSFGVRGGVLKGRDEKLVGTEWLWRLEAGERRYVLKTRKIPLPRAGRKKQ